MDPNNDTTRSPWVKNAQFTETKWRKKTLAHNSIPWKWYLSIVTIHTVSEVWNHIYQRQKENKITWKTYQNKLSPVIFLTIYYLNSKIIARLTIKMKSLINYYLLLKKCMNANFVSEGEKENVTYVEHKIHRIRVKFKYLNI